MNETEKSLFEVHGYLILKGLLSPAEVAAANAAIDHHADQIGIRPNDLANESTTQPGTTGRGAAGNLPVSLQPGGGTSTQAKNLHLMAASPTGTQHCGSGTEIFRSDPVVRRLEPVNGCVRIPEEPGLGVELDHACVELHKSPPPTGE